MALVPSDPSSPMMHPRVLEKWGQSEPHSRRWKDIIKVGAGGNELQTERTTTHRLSKTDGRSINNQDWQTPGQITQRKREQTHKLEMQKGGYCRV